MPKTAAKTGPTPISLRLAWTGGSVPAHVPLRDLDEGDLHRIHRIRALLSSGGEPVEPPTPIELEAIAAELASTGAFTREAVPQTDPEGRVTE